MSCRLLLVLDSFIFYLMKKDYSPKNHPSKRYTSVHSLQGYEAGGFCRGHKTRHADNQSLSQLIRTREKRQFQNVLSNSKILS